MLELHSASYGESVLESSALICSDIGLSTHGTATVSSQILEWDTAYVHVYLKNSRTWQPFLDDVVDIDVGYEANDSNSKHSSGVYLSYTTT